MTRCPKVMRRRRGQDDNRAGLTEASVEIAMAAVQAAPPEPWKQVDEGHSGVSDLPRVPLGRLAGLGLHTLRVIGAGDLAHHRR